MLRVVDEALDMAIKILETPSISDDELPLFMQLLYVALLTDTIKDVEWHGVDDQFEEAIATESPAEILKVANVIKQAKEFPRYFDRPETIARYRKVRKRWQVMRAMLDADAEVVGPAWEIVTRD